MVFKRKNEPKEPKYKATYKSLYSGNIKEFAIVDRDNALVNFYKREKTFGKCICLLA